MELSGLPRVRGGAPQFARATRPMGRSIPACGSHSLDRLHRGGGSIPALAREPRPGCRSRAPGWVHPRVCGGARIARAKPVACLGRSPRDAYEHGGVYLGPSPRVRGSPRHRLLRRDVGGSIPACAGEPNAAKALGIPFGVHPHVCGGASHTRSPPRDCTSGTLQIKVAIRLRKGCVPSPRHFSIAPHRPILAK